MPEQDGTSREDAEAVGVTAGSSAGQPLGSERVKPPEPAQSSPLTSWQRAELCALFLVIAVQLWLYKISVVAAAAWGVLVPLLLIHVYSWMAPLVRQQREHGRRDNRDLPPG